MNKEIKCIETREIEKVEERLHDKDGVKDEHTQLCVEDNGGELADCLVTRCKQLDSLLQEQRETLCSLEADHDQVSSVVSSEVGGASVAKGYTQSLVGVKAPEPPVVARFPSAIVPVCVVKGVSAANVLKRVPSVSENACVSETPRVSVTARVSSMVCVGERARVSQITPRDSGG